MSLELEAFATRLNAEVYLSPKNVGERSSRLENRFRSASTNISLSSSTSVAKNHFNKMKIHHQNLKSYKKTLVTVSKFNIKKNVFYMNKYDDYKDFQFNKN